jgi:hypothetical protein
VLRQKEEEEEKDSNKLLEDSNKLLDRSLAPLDNFIVTIDIFQSDDGAAAVAAAVAAADPTFRERLCLPGRANKRRELPSSV